MKIVELRAENFKRLTAVRIHPDGSLALITGRNAQGKSSVLDAVWAALGGKAATPAKPVREGAERATVFLDLGELRVTRHFSGDRTTLTVESKEGLRHSSPQAVLDKLVGKLTFDPLEFARLDGKKRATVLREIVGLDLSALDGKRQALFDQRTNVNREAKALQAQVDAMPEIDAPDEEVSVTELAKRHKAASEQRAAFERTQRKGEEYEREVATSRTALANAQQALDAATTRFEAAKKIADDYKAIVASAQVPTGELDAIAAQMETAEKTNAEVRAKKARATKLAELDKQTAAAAALTDRLAAIDELKQSTLDSVKFPVPGLSVDGDAVTMNGLPFDQASSAEQLRVGLAIGAALNPKLRVVLVRDGSLLDENGLRMVAEWAEQNNMQVLMERVADGKGGGIVIEDGEVAATPAHQVDNFGGHGEQVRP